MMNESKLFNFTKKENLLYWCKAFLKVTPVYFVILSITGILALVFKVNPVGLFSAEHLYEALIRGFFTGQLIAMAIVLALHVCSYFIIEKSKKRVKSIIETPASSERLSALENELDRVHKYQAVLGMLCSVWVEWSLDLLSFFCSEAFASEQASENVEPEI